MSTVTTHDVIAIVCALLTALANGLAVTTQHIASTSSDSRLRGWRFLVYLLHHPLWLFGWLAMGASLLFQSLALHFAAMSLVQPLLVTELVLALVLRRFWLRQRVSGRAWMASLVATLALALFLAMVAATSSATTSITTWVAPSAWSVAAVALMFLGGLRGSPSRRASCWGAATAVLWALEAALIKECTDVLAGRGFSGLVVHWSFCAFVLCGVAGLLCEQSALHVGPLRNSQTAIVVVDPVVSVALGIWIFHERLGGSLLAHAVAFSSLVVALAATAVLIVATPDNLAATSRPSPR